MTTFISAADEVAEWERTEARYGYMPPVSEETAVDTDYLVTRLREVMSAAAEFAATSEVSEFMKSGQLEAIGLRVRLEELVDELRPYGRAGSELLGSLQRLCPGVKWSRSRSGFDGTGSSWALVDPIEPAARRLRLRADEKPGQWVGAIEGWPVRLRPSLAPQQHRSELDASTVDFLAAVGADLVPIPWHTGPFGLHGHAFAGGGLDEATVAARWAVALGLGDVARDDGRGEYVGDTAIGRITVVWIYDEAQWDAAAAAARAWRKSRRGE